MKLEDFEIGKTYINSKAVGTKFKCLVKNSFGNPVVEHLNGTYTGTCFQIIPAATLNDWKEYHEPVVHRRKLLWIKREDGVVYTAITDINEKDSYIINPYSPHKIVKIEEISYTEE